MAGPAVLGYPDLRATAPGPAMILIGCIYTLPMAAVMRLRGMSWRPIAEMSAATVGLAVVFVALAAVNILSSAELQHWAPAFCMPACVVMLPVMLLRLDMYTGRTAHTAHA